jgi:small subunit ribosomal protein S2
VTFPVPGNDDAIRAIAMYCDLMAGAVIDGLQQEMLSTGVDVGEAEVAPQEQLPPEQAEAGAQQRGAEAAVPA